jgi:hypothetical protein
MPPPPHPWAWQRQRVSNHRPTTLGRFWAFLCRLFGRRPETRKLPPDRRLSIPVQRYLPACRFAVTFIERVPSGATTGGTLRELVPPVTWIDEAIPVTCLRAYPDGEDFVVEIHATHEGTRTPYHESRFIVDHLDHNGESVRAFAVSFETSVWTPPVLDARSNDFAVERLRLLKAKYGTVTAEDLEKARAAHRRATTKETSE